MPQCLAIAVGSAFADRIGSERLQALLSDRPRSALKVSVRLYIGTRSAASVASRLATAPSSTIKVDRQDFGSQ